jgi:hypothetical protein
LVVTSKREETMKGLERRLMYAAEDLWGWYRSLPAGARLSAEANVGFVTEVVRKCYAPELSALDAAIGRSMAASIVLQEAKSRIRTLKAALMKIKKDETVTPSVKSLVESVMSIKATGLEIPEENYSDVEEVPAEGAPDDEDFDEMEE